MKITVERILAVAILVCAIFMGLFGVIQLARSYIPPNHITHQCVPDLELQIKNIDNLNPSAGLSKDSFCTKAGEKAAFKNSLIDPILAAALIGVYACIAIIVPTALLVGTRLITRMLQRL